MKQMIIIAICSLLLAGPGLAAIAYAEEPVKAALVIDGIDLSKLSSSARDEIIRVKAKAVDETKTSVIGTVKDSNLIDTIKNADPNKFKEWASGAASGVRIFCTEIGVSVNEFIKTPAGMGICAIILYKYIGVGLIDKAIRVVIRSSLFLFNCMIFIFGFRYLYGNKKKTTITGTGKEAVKTVEKSFRFPQLHGGDADFFMVGGFILLMVFNCLAFGLAIAASV